MTGWGYAATVGFITQKMVFLWALVATTGTSMFVQLWKWDALWYARVIEEGYAWPGTVFMRGGGSQSTLAFFPLYPKVAEAVGSVTGLDTAMALYVTAWVASVVAAVGIYAVGKQVAGRNTGLLLALLWGAAPRALTQVMPYSEGPFVALAAWTMWALLTKRWWLAGALTALAGLTRPAALPLIATLWVLWLATVVRERRPAWRQLGAAALGTSGFAAYWAYAGVKVGDFFGYFQVQDAWGTTLGTPFDTLATVITGDWDRTTDPMYTTWIFAVLVGYTLLLAWMIYRKEPLPLIVFTALVLLLVWSQQGFFYAKARFLIPAFPALLPLARLGARMPRWVQAVAIAAITAASVAWDLTVITGRWSP